ncbi:hypothetical protein EXIGLDRAFT_726601 [Exidia glandulosa HHB12029]|uniref:BTB domain-containing protein n=1 Tax=Exidia glandulosa HHB12029 TaxID=1314781 RepID=A0A165DN70_EXIGL|nr:hypothetical protein EXIGLDRAFT_726601 [Exidia glandulosa HHB12029]
MSQLHVAFLTGQQQRFQRLLDASRPSQSANVSASLSSSGGAGRLSLNIDVNARDDQGRTVLHLACASLERFALECVRLLLAHPAIQLNAQDVESHWTPLHRALYAGNVEAALLLLQRPETDVQLKDSEGYTAFDLYNSTVEGTSPERDVPGDVYTWGTNRNATLGHGDADDRAFPDSLDLPPDDAKAKSSIASRFTTVPARHIAMGRLHTGLLTAEPQRNLRLCGIASAGRLGPSQTASGTLQIQYAIAPLSALPHNIAAIALGQDHSLAVTSSGELFSWGSNRYGQLGYVIEGAAVGDIQAAPRKIAGGLRKEKVHGVAACRTASACWTTEGHVYTWGTNVGQLGYDRTANQQIQVLPRRVTTLEEQVASVALSDSAMVCLLRTSDVLCYYRDSHFKISFPYQSFPTGMASLVSPRKPCVVKISNCDNNFVALTSWGEVLTFNLPGMADGEATKERGNTLVKPQRVWDARKRFSTVKDVALGLDGAIILCTESGHVFMRQPNIKAAQGLSKPAKFQRMSHLQRITAVAASPTGSFAAIRVDSRPEPIDIVGESVTEQIARIAPYWGAAARPRKTVVPKSPPTVLSSGHVRIVFSPQPQVVLSRDTADADDDDDIDARIRRDVAVVQHLCDILEKLRAPRADDEEDAEPAERTLDHGPDVVLHVSGTKVEIPAHLVVLLSRCPALRTVLSGTPVRDTVGGISIKSSAPGPARLALSGVQPLTVLVLLEYVYTDQVVLAWEPRVALATEAAFKKLKVRAAQLRGEMQALARALGMEELERSLSRVFPSPAPMMTSALSGTLKDFTDVADIVLELKDREVHVHSAVLRARSPFFAAFFDDEDWTQRRREGGVLRVGLRHLAWREMDYVLRYMYSDLGLDIFNNIDFVKSANELIDFYFSVLAVADELLLEKLILICSSAIIQRINLWNACAILTDASMYCAAPLVRSTQGYIARNFESMVEARLLDNLDRDVLKNFAVALRTRQQEKAPWIRSVEPLDALMAKWADWLEEQDIPGPITRPNIAQRASRIGASPKLSPIQPGLGRRRSSGSAQLQGSISPLTSPTVVPSDYRAPAGDEIFEMDEEPLSIESVAGSSLPATPTTPAASAPVAWKIAQSQNATRSDLRAIIAETENSRVRPSTESSPSQSSEWMTQQRPRDAKRQIPGDSSPAWRNNAAPPSPLPGPSTPAALRGPQASSAAVAIPRPATTRTLTPVATPPNSGLAQTRPVALRSPPSVATGTSTPSPARGAALGPTISPLPAPRRPSSPSLNVRRVSGQRGPAWVPAQPQPSPPLTVSGVMSFAAIQQQERDRNAMPTKPKKSLLEIQAEEARREAERQAEEDFMRWWNAEEARIQAEEAETMRRLSPPAKSSSKPAKKKAKPKNSQPSSGKGRPAAHASSEVSSAR